MEQEEKQFNDLKSLAERFIEYAQKYLDNTVEITRTVRLPKGEYCEHCVFRKTEYLYPVSIDSNSCFFGNSYVWCTLYGERLEIDKEKFNAVIPALSPCDPLTYRKCKQCKIDTAEKS